MNEPQQEHWESVNAEQGGGSICLHWLEFSPPFLLQFQCDNCRIPLMNYCPEILCSHILKAHPWQPVMIMLCYAKWSKKMAEKLWTDRYNFIKSLLGLITLTFTVIFAESSKTWIHDILSSWSFAFKKCFSPPIVRAGIWRQVNQSPIWMWTIYI